MWKPSKFSCVVRMRPRSRWFPPPVLMLLLLMLLLIVLSLHPRLSNGLHARCRRCRTMLEDRYYTHILACSHAASHRTIYSLLSTHTHTHIHTEKGESSKLRRGFVPLMNLQRDSIESPFTYMYVINTTYLPNQRK